MIAFNVQPSPHTRISNRKLLQFDFIVHTTLNKLLLQIATSTISLETIFLLDIFLINLSILLKNWLIYEWKWKNDVAK